MKKYIGWALIASVVILVGWFLVKSMIRKSSAAVAPESSADQSGSDAFPLKVGSSGKRVVILQKALNDFLSSGEIVPVDPLQKIPGTLEMDGIFGAKTLEVVRYFWGIDQIDQSKYYNLTGGR